ncbi:MAG: ParB/RepB/Spo0J family partition protein [Eubacteriales bacterium]|nr:ParB/RepB/Spo0J family partition protein [Eubacteriales bacterium]
MKKSSASKINLSSYDDLFGKAPDLKDCVEVDLSLLYDFENHPFQVNDDEDMAELVASIKDRGILEPGIVRPRPDGGYEVIAGHRRKHAAALAGLSTMPVFVKNLSDAEAVDLMVYSNLKRSNIRPSEKAFAYRMQMEAMRHPGSKGISSADMVGRKYGDNARKVQRYIRLTYLHPTLLSYVDNGKLAVQAGGYLSYLTEEEQAWVLEVCDAHRKYPSGAQAEKLKEHSKEKKLTQPMVYSVIIGKPKNKRRVVIETSHLNKYFSEEYNEQEIQKIIFQLLDKWKQTQE